MLDDPKLVERLLNDQEVFVRVSPYLMFSVLLRRVRRDLEGQAYVLERDDRGKRVPVFEAPQTVELLKDSALREHLTEMLCSFVRTNTGLLYWKERGTWRKRKFSDLDMDDMIALCQLVEQHFKPRLYKRVADIALFLTGILRTMPCLLSRAGAENSNAGERYPTTSATADAFMGWPRAKLNRHGPHPSTSALQKIHPRARSLEHVERLLP